MLPARLKFLLLLCSVGILAGCAHPLQSISIDEIPIEKGSREISMGDVVLTAHACPCSALYKPNRSIDVKGFKAIPYGSVWRAAFRNTETNGIYLYNEQYHRQVAVVLDGGEIDPAHAVVQFIGMNRWWRTWRLSNPEDATSMRPAGHGISAGTWRLYYIGPEKGGSSVVRLSIEEYGGDFDERIGQVEYRHDRSNGDEFVVRGVRIRIDDVSGDGLMRYTILDVPGRSS